MKSTTSKVVILVVLAAVAVALFVVLSGDDDDGGESTTETTASTPVTTVPPQPEFDRIVLRNGEVVGGVQELEYTEGDVMRFEVTVDEPQEEIHLHGYDVTKTDVSGAVEFKVPATIEGIFELEAHGPSGDVELAEITVNPS